MTKKIGKVLTAAAISMSLGYGATQAFASTATTGQAEFCRTAQERAECAIECESQGKLGYCYPDIGCQCE